MLHDTTDLNIIDFNFKLYNCALEKQLSLLSLKSKESIYDYY